MTVICAYQDPESGDIWLGSDSRVTDNWSIMPTAEPKWIVDWPRAIAVAGEGRADTILKTLNLNGEATHDAITISYLIRDLLKAETEEFRQQFVRGGTAFIFCDQRQPLCSGVYSIDCFFGVTRIQPGEFFAEGSGARHAEGAASVILEHPEIFKEFGIRLTIETAIETAIARDAGCGYPIHVHKLPRKEEER